MTVIHFLIHNWRRHAAYASLCVRSLRENGGVSPSQCVATLTDNLAGTPEAHSLRELGVWLRYVPNSWHQKMIAVESLFAGDPEITSVIQLDTDCTLTEKVPFIPLIKDMSEDAHLGAYEARENTEDFTTLYMRRAPLWLPAFRPDGVEAIPRLNALMTALLGLDYLSFVEGIDSWIYGGLTVYQRTIRATRAWKAMQALAWLTRCDETIIQLVRESGNRGGAKFRYLDHARLPHRVSPKKFDLFHGPGMFHYAGDWYREAPAHRAKLEEALSRLFWMELPTDGPVRPKAAPARPLGAQPSALQGQRATK